MPVTWIETREVPIGDLTDFEGNARVGDVNAIRESVRRHGQYRALVVRDTGNGLVILAGHHTRDALAAEGREAARCEIIQCDDEEAKRIVLADNKLAELGGYDNEALAELLADLDADYEGTGYTDRDMEELLKATAALAANTTAFLADFLPPEGGDPALAAPAAQGAPPAALADPFNWQAAAAAPAPAAAAPAASPFPGQPAPAAGAAPHPAQPNQGSGPQPTGGTEAPLPPPPQLFTVQWMLLLEQRDTVRTALKRAQALHGLDVSAEALVRICQHYLDTTQEPEQ